LQYTSSKTPLQVFISATINIPAKGFSTHSESTSGRPKNIRQGIGYNSIFVSSKGYLGASGLGVGAAGHEGRKDFSALSAPSFENRRKKWACISRYRPL